MQEASFWSGCPAVEIVDGRLNGRAVVRGSRVAAETILECEELGETANETAENYGLNVGDVLEIRAFVQMHRGAIAS